MRKPAVIFSASLRLSLGRDGRDRRTGVGLVVIVLVSAIYFLIEKPTNNLSLVKRFAIIVFLETLLVIVQGFIGGQLVYKYHFGIEASSPITDLKRSLLACLFP